MTKNGTQDGTPKGENTPLDPDLMQIIQAWPDLPAGVREEILRLAGMSKERG